MKNLNQLVETRLKEIQANQDRLVNSWAPYVKAINEHLQKTQDREMGMQEARNVAQCLENALTEAICKKQNKLFEATTEDAIDFLGVQLPVIAAMMPSQVLNEISNTQALDRRVGGVFFLDILAGTAKGSVARGATLASARTGHARTMGGRRYASTMVKDEALPSIDSGGETGAQTYQLAYYPGINTTTKGSIVIRDENGVNVADNTASASVITGTAGTGSINGTTGILSMTWTTTISSGYTIDYEYQYDLPVDSNGNKNGVPELDVNVYYESVTAKDFPIRSKWSVGAAFDLLKAHNINLENEVVKYLGGEARWTVDHYGIDLIDDAACGLSTEPDIGTPATAVTEWVATVADGEPWLWKKHQFLDRIEEGNNNIIEKTLRAMATFIVGGSNVIRVIRQLPNFKPTNLGKTPPTGPYKAGTLDGRTVIHDPFMKDVYIGGTTLVRGTNRYILGYKGDNILMSGFIHAPYIPLFSTQTLTTSDLIAQKGFYAASGFKTVNAGMFCYGKISGL